MPHSKAGALAPPPEKMERLKLREEKYNVTVGGLPSIPRTRFIGSEHPAAVTSLVHLKEASLGMVTSSFKRKLKTAS